MRPERQPLRYHQPHRVRQARGVAGRAGELLLPESQGVARHGQSINDKRVAAHAFSSGGRVNDLSAPCFGRGSSCEEECVAGAGTSRSWLCGVAATYHFGGCTDVDMPSVVMSETLYRGGFLPEGGRLMCPKNVYIEADRLIFSACHCCLPCSSTIDLRHVNNAGLVSTTKARACAVWW